jgi:hypothetical protein
MPAVSNPKPSTFGLRPKAAKISSASTDSSAPSCSKMTRLRSAACSTRTSFVPVRTSIPSRSKLSRKVMPMSWSSDDSKVALRCTIVTRVPARDRYWASSTPTEPPPSTMTLCGSAVMSKTSSLVT